MAAAVASRASPPEEAGGGGGGVAGLAAGGGGGGGASGLAAGGGGGMRRRRRGRSMRRRWGWRCRPWPEPEEAAAVQRVWLQEAVAEESRGLAGGGAAFGGCFGLPSGPSSSLACATTIGAPCACDTELAKCIAVRAVVASSTRRSLVMMIWIPEGSEGLTINNQALGRIVAVFKR